MRSIVLIFAIVIALVGGSIFAQDSIPNEDPTENACYAGGVMSRVDGEGCASEWAWQCGWYLATWQKVGGWYPDWCESVFPSVPVSTSVPIVPTPVPIVPTPVPIVPTPVPPVYIGCVYIGTSSGFSFYIDFGWDVYLTQGSTYIDNDCTTSVPGYTQHLVYASSLDEANAICLANVGTSVVSGPLEGVVYTCGDPI
jgi:hypothetical protein